MPMASLNVQRCRDRPIRLAINDPCNPAYHAWAKCKSGAMTEEWAECGLDATIRRVRNGTPVRRGFCTNRGVNHDCSPRCPHRSGGHRDWKVRR